mgnify:CR=1 FL=1
MGRLADLRGLTGDLGIERTLQPLWRQTDNGLVAVWEYGIPQRHWCAVRARFDAWAICGQVTVCDRKDPVMGVRVLVVWW